MFSVEFFQKDKYLDASSDSECEAEEPTVLQLQLSNNS